MPVDVFFMFQFLYIVCIFVLCVWFNFELFLHSLEQQRSPQDPCRKFFQIRTLTAC